MFVLGLWPAITALPVLSLQITATLLLCSTRAWTHGPLHKHQCTHTHIHTLIHTHIHTHTITKNFINLNAAFAWTMQVTHHTVLLIHFLCFSLSGIHTHRPKHTHWHTHTWSHSNTCLIDCCLFLLHAGSPQSGHGCAECQVCFSVLLYHQIFTQSHITIDTAHLNGSVKYLWFVQP